MKLGGVPHSSRTQQLHTSQGWQGEGERIQWQTPEFEDIWAYRRETLAVL